MRIELVVGDMDSGKTAFIKKFAEKHGADGILSVKRFEDRRFLGYDAVILRGGQPGESHPFLREAGSGFASPPGSTESSWFAYRRFLFSSRVFSRCMELHSAWSPPVIIDEIGPLEFEGRGFSALVSALNISLARRSAGGSDGRVYADLVLSVRPSLADRLCSEMLPSQAVISRTEI